MAGLGWRQVLASWLAGQGHHISWHLDYMSVAMRMAISADVVRPSLPWLLSEAMGRGALVRAFAATRDPGGFARLRAHCDASPEVSERAAARMLHRSSLIMAAKGGTLAEITVGDVAELLDAESAAHGRIGDGTTLFYKTLREIGILGDQAPPALRHLRTPGQLTPEQMIDRYNLACRPVRDLLADYLKERQPALDYNSLDALARDPGRPVLGRPRSPPSRHLQPPPARRGRPLLETATADHHQEGPHPGRPEHAGRRPAAQLPRVPDPRAGLLPGPGPLGGRRPRPLGGMGGAVPRQPGRGSPAQVHAPAQGTNGRAHPRAPAPAPRPGGRPGPPPQGHRDPPRRS